MVVCLCQGVSESSVRQAIEDGAATRRQVTAACGAGGICGGCHATIAEMITECPGRAALRRNAALASRRTTPGIAAVGAA